MGGFFGLTAKRSIYHAIPVKGYFEAILFSMSQLVRSEKIGMDTEVSIVAVLPGVSCPKRSIFSVHGPKIRWVYWLSIILRNGKMWLIRCEIYVPGVMRFLGSG
jgi:hypothetical protein